MTSESRTASRGLDPILDEAARVQGLAELGARLRAIGALRLLYGESPLARLIGDAAPRGQLSPSAARETLTRQAIRRKEARRRALRSGSRGLTRALAVA